MKIVTAAEIEAWRRRKKRSRAATEGPQKTKSPKKESTVRRSDKNRRLKRMRRPEETPQSLEELLKLLQIGPADWDFLMVGDGSGSTLDRECGHACVVIERATLGRTVHYGGMSHGTNIMAEMLAYVTPLLYLTHERLKRGPRGVRIHIVSDCQYLSTVWKHRHSVRKNRELWALFDVFTRRGIDLRFHWIPRDTWQLNQYCDTLAGRSRLAQQTLAEQSLAARQIKTVYDLNPTTE